MFSFQCTLLNPCIYFFDPPRYQRGVKRKLFWKELFLQSDFYISPSPQSDLYSEIVCSLTSVWWENIKVVGKYFATTFYRKQCSLLKVSPQGLLVGSTRQKIIANSRLPFEARPLSWWKPQELDITPELKGTVLRSCKMSNLLHGENTEVRFCFH